MQGIDQVRSGVDYLTATLNKGVHNAGWWASDAFKLLQQVADDGHLLRQYRMLGYDGHGAGGCFVGERETDYIAQFSGHYADSAFWPLFGDEIHISRIDLRVDVVYSTMPKGIAKKGYRDAIRANEGLPVQRRRKVYLLMGSDGGDTLYLGSPTSEQRGRLYNKEVQSEDPFFERTWRYECVYRNDSAGRVAQIITHEQSNATDTIRSIVASWYKTRGIHTRQLGGSRSIAVPLARTLPSDVEKRLSWLRNQVGPALRYLQEMGATEEMLDALGITLPTDT